ncbi:MAG: pyridoxamine 5'-phosphate oxidase [Sneathiella sp.]|uniref:pyridoxamine 5'-phosphate oxidase family protein n=1 Tax=Sneathiella sp. TaxID=1964365 RepID=UPI000C5741F4|nr:pyridoxamine 5'-phosphate oxidase family protein [Sneathiella sp.]MAZ01654.1 pyridoxamine 5'-phosphate oxidase [Sneathiella sp.]
MSSFISDVAFTPAVKTIQARKGSRETYARAERKGMMEREITDDLVQFISLQRSVFMASVSSEGAPYIQHRGGPPGFIKVLGPTTLGFADFKGNRQYISHGNYSENPKAHLFLIDYMHRRRVKIWGEVKVIEDDPELMGRLMPENYKGQPEQVMIFEVSAWDINCPQHIPQRIDAEDVKRALDERDSRIAELEAKIERLKHIDS